MQSITLYTSYFGLPTKYLFIETLQYGISTGRSTTGFLEIFLFCTVRRFNLAKFSFNMDLFVLQPMPMTNENTKNLKQTNLQMTCIVRVATAQGKQGIWMFIFPDRENTGNLPKNIKNMILHREFASNTGKILKF